MLRVCCSLCVVCCVSCVVSCVLYNVCYLLFVVRCGLLVVGWLSYVVSCAWLPLVALFVVLLGVGCSWRVVWCCLMLCAICGVLFVGCCLSCVVR